MEEKETNINKLHITTTISVEYKKYLEEKNIKTSDALARGIKALMNDEKLPHENEELRFKVEKMATRLSEQAGRITQLEESQSLLRE